jgi:biopolymer transport protein ExbD
VKRGESPQIQPAQASDIGSIWRQEFAGNPNLIAAVKTSPQAPYRFMVDVLDQLQAARADKISLQILE